MMWERLEGRGGHPVGWRKENRLDSGSAGCLSLEWGESRVRGRLLVSPLGRCVCISFVGGVGGWKRSL